MIVPETIGEAKEALADEESSPLWSQSEEGELTYRWKTEGKVDFCAAVSPGDDFIDVGITLTNVGSRKYRNVLSFTCFNPGVRPAELPSQMLPEAEADPDPVIAKP